MDSASDDDIEGSEPELVYRPLKFSNDCARLPVDSPADRAHLIDMSTYSAVAVEEAEEYEEGEELQPYDVKIWDAICTLLFNISKTVLDHFLDSQTFQLVHELSDRITLIIWRQGCQVLVGRYVEYVNENMLEFDAVVRAKINCDGSWKLTSATYGKYTKNDLKDLWNEVYVRARINREIVDPTEETRSEYARKLGIGILNIDCCNDLRSYTLTIKVT